MKSPAPYACLLLMLACSATTRAVGVQAYTDDTARTAAWFEAHRHEPPQLRSFLQRMPKGGDLHNHLSGAVYAESYVEWAAEADYCIVESADSWKLVPCASAAASKPGTVTRVADALHEPALFDRLIDRLSTRNLAFAGRSGHDQFFAAFGEFGPISSLRIDDMVVEVAMRAASQRVHYLELMLTLQSKGVRELARKVGLDEDFAVTRQKLFGAGLRDLVEAGQRDLDLLETEVRRTLRCDGDALPGCAVTIRYLQQTTRTNPPAEVFAQLVYAVELVRADPRVVGLNLVAPEDDRTALADYTLHMEMLDHLVAGAPAAPEVNVALHAGELTLGLVRPKDLRFHIRQAVELGHARRVGHGVGVAHEDDAHELLETMRDRGVLVEICLTSNDVILGVRGDDHPLSMYLAAGIPVALATDDEGVSRIDLTHEYQRAATTYGLGYRELKSFARNSLEHAFLPGESLWSDPRSFVVADACAGDPPGAPGPSRRCATFLAGSERAREQWRLEAEFAAFEASFRHP